MNKFLLAVAGTLICFAPCGQVLADSGAVSYPPLAPAGPIRLKLNLETQTFTISQATAQNWFGEQVISQNPALKTVSLPLPQLLAQSLGSAPSQPPQPVSYHYRLNDIYNYLKNLAGQIDTTAVEPVLELTGTRVATFTPPQEGLALDIYQNSLNIETALELGHPALPLLAYRSQPKTSLAQTNSLGINELIGEGVSNFKGSPHNRRVNIAVGLQKFQGLIIPPGATFSFDDNLGPVTASAGFLPELVIDNGTTLPELGGGLCQVSTTMFRAAMATGLPILARRNHAYAVTYYSPQGTDATIYPGSADLKFVNDTPGAIMIWPYEKDSNTLIFDFYGTSDDRQVTLEQPVVYDRKTDGSMKATWTRLVTSAAGITRTDVFHSTYQPPALFHKTETYVSATGTPSAKLN